MKTILLLLALSTIAYSGQIWSWADIDANNNQVGSTAEVILYFNLESPLPPSGYMKLALPFATSGVSISGSVRTPNSRCALGTSSIASDDGTTLAAETNSYFLSFASALDRNVNYALRLSISTPSTVTAAGLSGQIGLSTTTSAVANYLTIDSNPTFGDFEWVANTTTLVLSDNAVPAAELANSTVFSAGYNYNFAFTPAAVYLGGAKVQISLSNSKFTMPNCTVVSIGTENVTANLPTCSVVDGVATFDAVNGFSGKVTMRLGITNPPDAITQSDVHVRIYRRFGDQLIESGVGSSYLQTKFTTSITGNAIRTAFNIAPPSTTNHPIRFYRGTIGATGVDSRDFYQVYKFVFKLATPLPAKFKSTVKIDLSNATYILPLDASLHHNLDPVTGSSAKPICRVVRGANDAKSIECSPVGLSSATTEYFISIKIKATGNTNVTADLGKLTVVVNENGDGSVPSPSSEATVIANSAIGSVSLAPMLAVHNTKLGTALPKQMHVDVDSGAQRFYWSTNSSLDLFYWMNKANSTDLSIVKEVCDNAKDIGVDIYMNRYITVPASGSGSIGVFVNAFAFAATASDTAWQAFPNVTGVTGSNSVPYTRWRASYYHATADLAVNVAASSTDTKFYIRINNASITKAPSLRADEAAFEFYIGFLSNITNTTAEPFNSYTNKSGFYSTLIMTGPAPTTTYVNVFETLGVGIVGGNSADTTLNGRWPALIRITGTLHTNESTNANRLAIFFSNLSPYSATTANDNTVLCVASQNGTVSNTTTCNLIEGAHAAAAADDTTRDNVAGYSRIEITWSAISSTNVFQILIPVGIKAAGQTDIYVATLDSVGTPLAIGISQAGATAAVSSTASPYGADSAAVQYRFKVAASPGTSDKIGGNSSLSLTYVSSTAAANTSWNSTAVNEYGSAYKVSAGLQYCAVWNFYANQTIGSNGKAFATAGKGDDRCMTYSLAVVKSASELKNLIPYQAPNKWCIFCPIGAHGALDGSAQTVVTLTNYIFWTGGSRWPAKKWASPTVGCLYSGATTAGAVIECDDSYDTVNTGTITASINPASISNVSSNNRIGINLTLANPFPTAALPDMKVSSRIIYLRTTLNPFTQQGSTDCETNQGTCTLAFKVATNADLGDAVESTGDPTNPPTTITLNSPTSATSINIVLYGINPAATAAVISSMVSFSTRVVWSDEAGTNKVGTQLDTSVNSTFNVTTTGSVGNLDLSGIAFNNTLRGYRGGLKIPFKVSGRDFMRKEKIVITFNNAAFTSGVNAPANILCEAYAAPDQFLADIKSCLVDTTGITIEAQADIKTDGAPFILLRHYTAFDAGNTSVSGVLSIGGTTIQSTVATPNPAVVPSSVANGNGTVANLTATVSRVNNIIGGSSILQFNITNNLGVAVGAGWRILIDLPFYYAPKLSNLKRLVIHINGVPTVGDFVDQRHLQIAVPTVTIANGSSIILRILGVSSPRIPTGVTGSFWIALDNDTNSNYLPVMGTVADAAAAVEPTGMIWPYNMMFAAAGSAAVNIRSSATLQIVTVTRVALAVNQVISLDFPESWVGLVSASSAQSVTCQATFTSLNGTTPNFTAVAPAASFIGVLANTIRLNVTANLTAGSQLNISCSNFRTPDGPFASNCLPETPTIEVFDSNETVPLAKSSPSVHHFDRAAFTLAAPASLIVLTANQQNAKVIQGTSQADVQFIRISDTSPFSRAITASLVAPPTGVALHPRTGVAAVGDRFLPIGFSALPTAPLGDYTLILNKAETALTTAGANAYANLPTIRLSITNEKVKINGPDAEIKIPAGGTSVPLTYSFDYTPAPNADLTFTVTPNDTAVTVSPIPALKSGVMHFAFTLTIPRNAVSGSKVLVSLVPPSGAPAFSSVPAPFIVVVTDAITDIPTINVAVDAATTAATSQGLKLTIGTSSNSSTTPLGPHAVYYACALTTLALNRDLQYVQTQLSTAATATTQTPPPPGESYGMDTYTAPKGGEILRVTRIHASTEYTCRVWAVNQGNLNGSATVSFKTGSNEGRVVRVNANFLNNTDFSAQKIQNLVCWLAQSFAVPSRLVRSQDGQTCSGKALWSINWNLQQIGASFAYAVPIYFLPNLMLEKDTLATAVADGLKTASWMTQVVASQATTFASAALDTIVYPNTTAPVYAAPSVTNATDNTALTFTFVPSNNSASFIHIGVYAVNGSGTPTFADLTPFVSTAADPLAYTVAYYNGSAFNAPITVNASMTTGVTYNAYWVATCDNPSESSISCSTAVQGPIQVGKGTAAPPVDAGAGSTDARILSVSFSVIVALFLSFIL